MTEKTELKPTRNDDGNFAIPLAVPLDIDGAKVKALTMREPTVNDNLIAEEQGGGKAGQHEIYLFANLCQVTPEDIKRLKLRDYMRLQEAFKGFLD